MSSYLKNAVTQSRSMIAEAELTEIISIAKNIILIHKPISGEAREDKRKYCARCVDAFGSHRVYPCATIRNIEKILKLVGEIE